MLALGSSSGQGRRGAPAEEWGTEPLDVWQDWLLGMETGWGRDNRKSCVLSWRQEEPGASLSRRGRYEKSRCWQRERGSRMSGKTWVRGAGPHPDQLSARPRECPRLPALRSDRAGRPCPRGDAQSPHDDREPGCTTQGLEGAVSQKVGADKTSAAALGGAPVEEGGPEGGPGHPFAGPAVDQISLSWQRLPAVAVSAPERVCPVWF